jgi:hypothetical protein
MLDLVKEPSLSPHKAAIWKRIDDAVQDFHVVAFLTDPKNLLEGIKLLIN